MAHKALSQNGTILLPYDHVVEKEEISERAKWGPFSPEMLGPLSIDQIIFPRYVEELKKWIPLLESQSTYKGFLY